MSNPDNLELSFEASREILSVSALNREARLVIESSLGTVWVEGEISNLARPSSGHMYWSLKDASAQVRCAMFRQYGRQLSFTPDNGQHVLLRGRVSIYEARGDFQLIVDYMEDAGEGALRREFEQLKAKLAAEGLFDESRKRPLPVLPRRIGIITSPTGAAIRDVLTALRRRFPAVNVLIYPSKVQGEGAAQDLARALLLADARAECDLLILARGGGSLEDLWAFNEEVLARAIADVSTPIICGVGHETDFTIADFVADLRAPTPSQAAELAVPDADDWLARLLRFQQQLARATTQSLRVERQRLRHLGHRLQRGHPGVALRERAQRLDEIEARLQRAVGGRVSHLRSVLDRSGVRLRAQNPRTILVLRRQQARQLSSRLALAASKAHERSDHRLRLLVRALHSLSPLATLERGYAIVMFADGRAVVTNAQRLSRGDGVDVRLARGSFTATVDTTTSAGDSEE